MSLGTLLVFFSLEKRLPKPLFLQFVTTLATSAGACWNSRLFYCAAQSTVSARAPACSGVSSALSRALLNALCGGLESRGM